MAISNAPELLLHIGPGKTGTTSIQFTLRQNREELSNQGVFYAGMMLEDVPGADGYSWCVRGRPPEHLPNTTMQEAYQFVRGELTRQGDAGIRRVIWSNETFFDHAGWVMDLVERLRDGGVRVRPVAYMRRHDDWVRSAYIQWGIVHKTYPGPLLGFREWSQRRKLGFAKALEVWQAAFPRQLELYNFDVLEDVTQHFLGLAGLTGIETVRANETRFDALLAARAVFNGLDDGKVLPSVFDSLAGELKVLAPRGRPVPPLEQLLPTSEDLRSVQISCADDFEKVNTLLAAQGQAPLVFDDPLQEQRHIAAWELDRLLLQATFSLQQQVLDLQQEIAKLKEENGRIANYAAQTGRCHPAWNLLSRIFGRRSEHRN